MNSQTTSLILIAIASGLATVAYLHGNSDGVRGEMFTFAGAIVTGAFALLKTTDKASETAPKGSTVTTVEATKVDPPAV